VKLAVLRAGLPLKGLAAAPLGVAVGGRRGRLTVQARMGTFLVLGLRGVLVPQPPVCDETLFGLDGVVVTVNVRESKGRVTSHEPEEQEDREHEQRRQEHVPVDHFSCPP
jgi:hypothetical protein